jgi:hypothetical protein
MVGLEKTESSCAWSGTAAIGTAENSRGADIGACEKIAKGRLLWISRVEDIWSDPKSISPAHYRDLKLPLMIYTCRV